MKSKITFSPRLFKRGFVFVFVVCGLLMSATVKAELPTAQQIASKMKLGWNLGNTLEAIYGEGAWGGGGTSQRLIDSVKAAGFNAVRIPCSWYCHSDPTTNIINKDWMARVKEVVDYCIKDSMYVVINIHWDQGWLDDHINVTDSASVNVREHAFWTQIATCFKDYDGHLLFACANEPPAKNATQMSVLLSYYQTFINAVRATGGNNSSRTLIIQGPSADIDLTNQLMNTMPTDQIADRLMVEIHYYTPWQFCGMGGDTSWGKMFYYWGQNNHSTTDASRNSTWGEESYMDNHFDMMKTKFIDKGIPVIIGEYGAFRRKLNPPSDQALHDASIRYYYTYLVKSATERGLKTFCWDTPGWMFNHITGAKQDSSTINAIMEGAKEAKAKASATSATSMLNDKLIELYPNSFTSTFNLKISNPNNILCVSVSDLMGNEFEIIKHSDIKSSMVLGFILSHNLYTVQVWRKWNKIA